MFLLTYTLLHIVFRCENVTAEESVAEIGEDSSPEDNLEKNQVDLVVKCMYFKYSVIHVFLIYIMTR